MHACGHVRDICCIHTLCASILVYSCVWVFVCVRGGRCVCLCIHTCTHTCMLLMLFKYETGALGAAQLFSTFADCALRRFRLRRRSYWYLSTWKCNLLVLKYLKMQFTGTKVLATNGLLERSVSLFWRGNMRAFERNKECSIEYITCNVQIKIQIEKRN